MKKILVVEDEYYARKSIVKILQESDLDIQVCGEAANGMKAIELLEEYKDIALVITDIQMQKMGGLELASYLHKHIPEIDVLILTGVSNFTAEQIKEAEQYIQIDVQQPLYSMVDRGFEDLMSWGYDRGIDSMTYGSMGAGILSGKIRSVPSFEKNDLRLNFYDVYKEPKFSKIMELLKVMDSIADGHNVPVGQVALNWSTQKEYVGTALVGVRSIEHADENCKTFDWKLTEEEMKILDSKIEECAL